MRVRVQAMGAPCNRCGAVTKGKAPALFFARVENGEMVLSERQYKEAKRMFSEVEFRAWGGERLFVKSVITLECAEEGEWYVRRRDLKYILYK